MSSARKTLCGFYLTVALVALVGTLRQNLAFGQELGLSAAATFVEFWPALLVISRTTSLM